MTCVVCGLERGFDQSIPKQEGVQYCNGHYGMSDTDVRILTELKDIKQKISSPTYDQAVKSMKFLERESAIQKMVEALETIWHLTQEMPGIPDTKRGYKIAVTEAKKALEGWRKAND